MPTQKLASKTRHIGHGFSSVIEEAGFQPHCIRKSVEYEFDINLWSLNSQVHLGPIHILTYIQTCIHIHIFTAHIHKNTQQKYHDLNLRANS